MTSCNVAEQNKTFSTKLLQNRIHNLRPRMLALSQHTRYLRTF